MPPPIGFVLLDPSGAYWWAPEGGFRLVGSDTLPRVLPTREDARALALELRRTLGVSAVVYPVRLGAR